MNAPPRCRRPLRPASVAFLSAALTIGSGSNPAPLVALSPAVAVGWRADSLGPNALWNTLTADMSVQRRRIKDAGGLTATPPLATSYRIERSSRSGGWKTVITVIEVERAPVYSLSGALVPQGMFPVSRLEDDEDGTPVRAYDRAGRLMKSALTTVPQDAVASFAPPRSSGRDWIETFVATAARKSKRQQEFEHLFGKSTKAGALNRFLKKDLDSSQEVLVDPKFVVPMEMKAVRSGRLVSHRTFTYLPAPDAAVVRGSVHSETLISSESGERAVVDTAFSNIRLELRR